MLAATRHVPSALNTKKNPISAGTWRPHTHFGVFRTLLAANAVLFLLNEIYRLKQMFSVCTVCYRVLAY